MPVSSFAIAYDFGSNIWIAHNDIYIYIYIY